MSVGVAPRFAAGVWVGRRLIWLYLRSRGGAGAVLSLAVTSLLSWLLAIDPHSVLWASFLMIVTPMVPAVAIGASVYSPCEEVEDTVATRLGFVQLGYVLGLFFCAGVALTLPYFLAARQLPWHLLGTLIGDVGLILLGQSVVGPSWSWLVPLTYGVVVYVALLQDSQRAASGNVPPWMWPVLPVTNSGVLLMVFGLLIAGGGAVALRKRMR